MSFGFKAWHADGAVQVDETIRLGKILGIIEITSTVPRSISDGNILSGTPFYALIEVNEYQYTMDAISVVFSGSQMSWSFSLSGSTSISWPFLLVYGIR